MNLNRRTKLAYGIKVTFALPNHPLAGGRSSPFPNWVTVHASPTPRFLVAYSRFRSAFGEAVLATATGSSLGRRPGRLYASVPLPAHSVTEARH